ncbi:PPP4R2-domain-containing protein [Suillus ampliporus]|nr:PPP4R2-domain-containing protein [Suillus ampliporus]
MAESTHDISQNFCWNPDYDTVLEQMADSDVVEPRTEWDLLRDIIKYKVDKNIALFLADPPPHHAEEFQPLSEDLLKAGNLKLPPFPLREQNDLNHNEVPKVYMNQREADDIKGFIFRQLHEFDDEPPFTIQRVCELCVRPKQHYKALGKYLRAVEKSLLVTSSWTAFPAESSQEGPTFSSLSMTAGLLSTPTTPLFSPIAFYHEDARRSKSQSPPPSPLTLSGIEAMGHVEPLEGMPPKALGLVDELDDPSPGHLSNHPTALTAVTTVGSKPFLDSLEARFVRGEGQHDMGSSDQRLADGSGDKENKG